MNNTSSLLPIGAFSNATQLSVKALRLYAEHGVLVPARVDGETGYRYYRPEQVRDARVVRLLRDLDLPLAQIALLVDHPGATATAAKMQMDALARRYTQQQNTYHALLALLADTVVTHARTIEERASPATHTLVLGFEANACNLLARTQAMLARLRVQAGIVIASEAAFVPLPAALSEQDEIPLDLCVPTVQAQDAATTDECRVWPPATVAAVEVPVLDGIPDLVGASDALFDWFDRHGYSLREAPRLVLHPHTPTLVWPIS